MRVVKNIVRIITMAILHIEAAIILTGIAILAHDTGNRLYLQINAVRHNETQVGSTLLQQQLVYEPDVFLILASVLAIITIYVFASFMTWLFFKSLDNL